MDITKITKSKTREKILQLFFSNIDKKYYLRELERILEISVGNIRRELLMLETAGLFERERVGSEVYYSLNKNSAIFGDFKNIIYKTIGLEGTLKKGLKKLEGITNAFIFGSFAKNKESLASDIDLMVIGDVDEDALISKISKLESVCGREINYHLIDNKEWEEKSKNSSFIKTIMKGPKINII